MTLRGGSRYPGCTCSFCHTNCFFRVGHRQREAAVRKARLGQELPASFSGQLVEFVQRLWPQWTNASNIFQTMQFAHICLKKSLRWPWVVPIFTRRQLSIINFKI